MACPNRTPLRQCTVMHPRWQGFLTCTQIFIEISEEMHSVISACCFASPTPTISNRPSDMDGVSVATYYEFVGMCERCQLVATKVRTCSGYFKDCRPLIERVKSAECDQAYAPLRPPGWTVSRTPKRVQNQNHSVAGTTQRIQNHPVQSVHVDVPWPLGSDTAYIQFLPTKFCGHRRM